MNRREELQDRYEDALFALLMDDMAVAEGKKAQEENERLKNDPTAAVPEEVDRQCRKTIRRHFTKMRLRTAQRYTGRVLGKLMMVMGVISVLFICAFAASEAVRTSVLNLVVETFPDSTSFYFAEAQPENKPPQITVGWVPEGFTLVDEGQNNFRTWSIYQGSGGESFQAVYVAGKGTTVNLDTEGLTSSEVLDVNGEEARLYQKDDLLQIIWQPTDRTAFVALSGEGVSREDMLQIAKHLEY